MKISIVTPSFNSGSHIQDTIQSVITQSGNFSIEYFVVDNCSTDETKEIVNKFQILIASDGYPIGCNGIKLHFISEQDNGMYDAINKGFEKATGDVFAWINADDIYLPGAFATIITVFNKYDDIHWLTGITSFITKDTSIWKVGLFFIYAQKWINAGTYGRDCYFITQDSVFWRSWLWKKTGGIDINFKRAGDYYLWIRFSEFTSLITVKAWISCFRRTEGQISQDFVSYMREACDYSQGKTILSKKICWFFRLERRLPSVIRPCIFRLLFGQMEYSAVLINPEGKLNKVSGQYYTVLKHLF